MLTLNPPSETVVRLHRLGAIFGAIGRCAYFVKKDNWLTASHLAYQLGGFRWSKSESYDRFVLALEGNAP